MDLRKIYDNCVLFVASNKDRYYLAVKPDFKDIGNILQDEIDIHVSISSDLIYTGGGAVKCFLEATIAKPTLLSVLEYLVAQEGLVLPQSVVIFINIGSMTTNNVQHDSVAIIRYSTWDKLKFEDLIKPEPKSELEEFAPVLALALAPAPAPAPAAICEHTIKCNAGSNSDPQPKSMERTFKQKLDTIIPVRICRSYRSEKPAINVMWILDEKNPIKSPRLRTIGWNKDICDDLMEREKIIGEYIGTYQIISAREAVEFMDMPQSAQLEEMVPQLPNQLFDAHKNMALFMAVITPQMLGLSDCSAFKNSNTLMVVVWLSTNPGHELNKSMSTDECMICSGSPTTIAVLPCLHTVLCCNCAERLPSIPYGLTCAVCQCTISDICGRIARQYDSIAESNSI